MQLVTIEDGPHAIAWTHAGQVNRALMDFLAGCGVSPRPVPRSPPWRANSMIPGCWQKRFTSTRSAADLRAALPDQRGTTIALTGLALAEAALGNGHRARALGQEACRILDRSADIPGHHGALNNLGVVEILGARPAQATDALERALALGVPDTQRSFGWQHILLAGLRERSGDPAGATAALTAARECFQRIGERRGLGAVADLDRRLGAAGRGRAKRVQSPPGIESDRRNQ
jgi:hypothetical protein